MVTSTAASQPINTSVTAKSYQPKKEEKKTGREAKGWLMSRQQALLRRSNGSRGKKKEERRVNRKRRK